MIRKPARPARRRFLAAGTVAAFGGLSLSELRAQDASRVNRAAFRVVFENDRTRVLEFVSRPGTPVCGVGKHSHPAHLTIALSPAKVRVTLPDNKTIEATNVLGDVFWSEAETHAVENIGGANVRALIVEFKS